MNYSDYWISAGLPKTSKFFNVCKANLKGSDKYLEMVDKIFNWDFKNPSCVALLSDYNGNGKTHIAVCLMKKYIADQVKLFEETQQDKYLYGLERVKFKKAYDIELEILSSFKKESTVSEEAIIEKYCELDFLVIDDMFEKESEFVRHVMLMLVDKRIDWLCKPTVITSNKTFNEINEKIDSRIASRIDNELLFQIATQKDYRK